MSTMLGTETLVLNVVEQTPTGGEGEGDAANAVAIDCTTATKTTARAAASSVDKIMPASTATDGPASSFVVVGDACVERESIAGPF